MLRQIKPSYVYKQLKYRIKGAPDGYAVPPPHLVYRTIARGWAEQYYAMGRQAAEDIAGLLARNNLQISDFGNILDFGCGCGRIIRHFRQKTKANLHGTDYNSGLVNWCKKKLKFGDFHKNELAPPLSYENDKFDFIYLISVFTHLDGDLQKKWMVELRRVLRPGGTLLFTTHGDKYFEFLSEDRIEGFKRGEIVIMDDAEQGHIHYGSFQSQEAVSQKLLEGFELISFVPGPERLMQDTYLVRKTV